MSCSGGHTTQSAAAAGRQGGAQWQWQWQQQREGAGGWRRLACKVRRQVDCARVLDRVLPDVRPRHGRGLRLLFAQQREHAVDTLGGRGVGLRAGCSRATPTSTACCGGASTAQGQQLLLEAVRAPRGRRALLGEQGLRARGGACEWRGALLGPAASASAHLDVVDAVRPRVRDELVDAAHHAADTNEEHAEV